LHRDIFTHITSLPAAQFSAEEAKAAEDSLNFQTYKSVANSQFVTTKYMVEVGEIDRNPTHEDYDPEEGDIAIGANLTFKEPDGGQSFEAKPVIVLRGQLVYTYDDHINQFGVRARLKEETFNNALTMEEDLNYQTFKFQQGKKVNFNGYQVTFAGFDKKITHPLYKPEEGDIAVSAILSVEKDGKSFSAKPVYLIRESRPFNLKDEIASEGLHVRVGSIDPKTESVTVSIAKAEAKESGIVLDIAENATRNDWLVLEAIVFPGINFFWIGTLMMIFGLLFSMIHRLREKGIIAG